MRALIAEDDPFTRAALCEVLRQEGWDTVPAADGTRALAAFDQGGFDLVLLDIMMPGASGYDVCRAIRTCDTLVAVLFISAKAEEIDKVLGLELGADDFIMKPFSSREVLARIRAVLRRTLAAALARSQGGGTVPGTSSLPGEGLGTTGAAPPTVYQGQTGTSTPTTPTPATPPHQAAVPGHGSGYGPTATGTNPASPAAVDTPITTPHARPLFAPSDHPVRSPSSFPETPEPPVPPSFPFGPWTVLPDQLRVRDGTTTLDLSPRELALLDLFARNPGAALSRHRILEHCWGWDQAPQTRTLDQHIATLRKKIEAEPSSPRLITTVQGVGYRHDP